MTCSVQRRWPDTLVLGCTHFPVLVDALRQVVGPTVAIVDSAQTTALQLRATLTAQGLLSRRSNPPTLQLLATDGPERFARVGSRFLGAAFSAERRGLVDLTVRHSRNSTVSDEF